MTSNYERIRFANVGDIELPDDVLPLNDQARGLEARRVGVLDYDVADAQLGPMRRDEFVLSEIESITGEPSALAGFAPKKDCREAKHERKYSEPECIERNGVIRRPLPKIIQVGTFVFYFVFLGVGLLVGWWRGWLQ